MGTVFYFLYRKYLKNACFGGTKKVENFTQMYITKMQVDKQLNEKSVCLSDKCDHCLNRNKEWVN